MEAVNLVYAPASKFAERCRFVLNRCTLPKMKQLKKTALAAGAGVAILGTAGFVFKLVSIPINKIIIGSMAH